MLTVSPYVLIWLPLGVSFGVQLFKFLRESYIRRDWDWAVLVRTGGMPSSHSALVACLATAVGLRDSFASSTFAISFVFAVIVMYDARGVRQQSGKQARMINRIVRELFSGQPISEEELKELLGHTAFEVLVGALVGITAASLYFFFAA